MSEWLTASQLFEMDTLFPSNENLEILEKSLPEDFEKIKTREIKLAFEDLPLEIRNTYERTASSVNRTLQKDDSYGASFGMCF